jgi:LmbE family N-acetylglucosaminyl deacetylase
MLVVLTHGDDIVSIAPLVARYSAEGYMVHYAIFTGLQDPAGEENSPRRAEVQCAARALGVNETFVMRGPGGIEFETVSAVAERLIALINQTKPDVIVTWGPDGLTGHPRHILVNNVVTRVFQQQALLAHTPSKLYYIAYPESRFRNTRPDFGHISERSFGTVNDRFVTTRVDGSRYRAQTLAAIACYATAQGGYPSSAE